MNRNNKHKTMKKLLIAALLFASAASLTSCEDDSPSAPKMNVDLPYDMLITNEGNWTANNAGISIYNSEKDAIENDVFKKANGRDMGDILQSMKVVDTLGYFVLNHSGKIEVASLKTFKSKATIDGLGSPRYMETYNGKGYISNWDNDELVVIDLKTNTILKRIKVGVDPEGLLVTGNKLYVANSSGMGGKNNTVSVVDLTTDAVVKTIEVADSPRTFALDKDGNVWVACSGYIDWVTSANSTNAAICKINASTYAVTKIDLGTFRPNKICTNPAQTKVYYGSGWGVKGIYELDITATQTPSAPLINEFFYGFTVNPTTGEIYGFTDASDAKRANMVFRYSITGQLLNSAAKNYTVGASPNSGYFVK